MDEATKAKLVEAGLESVVTAFDALNAKVSGSETRIAEQDAIITQKNNDLVQARKGFDVKYKKLSEMTEAEKAELSDKEQEIIARQEAFDQKQADFEKQQAEFLAKEVGARKGRAFDSIVGNKNPELRKKVEEAFGKIVGSDKAQTDEEIATIATSAFNMLGVPRPDHVQSAINSMGGNPPAGREGGEGVGFAESEAGKSLASALGLQIEPAK